MLKALFLLVEVLVVSTLVIVPGQSPHVLGVELLALGLFALGSLAKLDLSNWRLTEAVYRTGMLKVLTLASAPDWPPASPGRVCWRTLVADCTGW